MVKAPKAIEAAMREGFYLFEWMHKRGGGQDFLATVQLTRITLQGVEGLQATVRDITEHRRAETELRAYATFQRAILDNAGYAIISCRSDGIIQLFNPAAETLLGYKADELIGRQHPGIFHIPEEVVARARQLSEEFGTPSNRGLTFSSKNAGAICLMSMSGATFGETARTERSC